jgi:hypothetical protein
VIAISFHSSLIASAQTTLQKGGKPTLDRGVSIVTIYSGFITSFGKSLFTSILPNAPLAKSKPCKRAMPERG